ncbi:MAG TPA: hypothetical protein VFD25_02035 [Clostridia bacterium]|nr:hypothetical protein [Clostridia bacterium]
MAYCRTARRKTREGAEDFVFQVRAVLKVQICGRDKAKIAGILPYSEIFNAVLA